MIIGRERFELTKETCVEALHGFYYPPLGCIVNASQPHVDRNGDILIFPLRTRKYPVLVEKDLFKNLTTDAGLSDNIHTYALSIL